MTDTEIEFEERAAIREYDGGLPRDEAERLTREELADFTPDDAATKPPAMLTGFGILRRPFPL